MNEATIIGGDLARNVFQLHGAAADGTGVFRKKFSRVQFARFVAGHPPCTVAMEACAGAHHWARELAGKGHRVRLIPPHDVKPFSRRQKNDAADAEAIVEAAQRPTMHFVARKSAGQRARAIAFRTLEQLVKQQTETVNALRSMSSAMSLRRGSATSRAWPTSWTIRTPAFPISRSICRMLLAQIAHL